MNSGTWTTAGIWAANTTVVILCLGDRRAYASGDDGVYEAAKADAAVRAASYDARYKAAYDKAYKNGLAETDNAPGFEAGNAAASANAAAKEANAGCIGPVRECCTATQAERKINLSYQLCDTDRWLKSQAHTTEVTVQLDGLTYELHGGTGGLKYVNGTTPQNYTSDRSRLSKAVKDVRARIKAEGWVPLACGKKLETAAVTTCKPRCGCVSTGGGGWETTTPQVEHCAEYCTTLGEHLAH